MNKILNEFNKKQTENLALKIVREVPSMLKDVKDQSLRVCLEAIKKKADSILYVREPSKELYLEALKISDEVFKFIPKDEDINLEAIRINPDNFKHLSKKQQSPKSCLLALHLKPELYRYCLITKKSENFKDVMSELEFIVNELNKKQVLLLIKES